MKWSSLFGVCSISVIKQFQKIDPKNDYLWSQSLQSIQNCTSQRFWDSHHLSCNFLFLNKKLHKFNFVRFFHSAFLINLNEFFVNLKSPKYLFIYSNEEISNQRNYIDRCFWILCYATNCQSVLYWVLETIILAIQYFILNRKAIFLKFDYRTKLIVWVQVVSSCQFCSMSILKYLHLV